jgi:hypothetical protein
MGHNMTTRYNKKGFVLIPNKVMTHGGSVIKPWKPLLNKPHAHIQRSHGIYNGHGLCTKVMGYGLNPAPTVRCIAYMVWTYAKTNDHGPGLSPDPTPHQRLQTLILNINQRIYMLSNNPWSVGRTVFAKA